MEPQETPKLHLALYSLVSVHKSAQVDPGRQDLGTLVHPSLVLSKQRHLLMRYGIIFVPVFLVVNKPPEFSSGDGVAGKGYVGGKFEDAFYTY